MNSHQFVSLFCFTILTALGGISLTYDQWLKSNAPERIEIIKSSKLDPILKDNLTKLVVSSSWHETNNIIADIRSEIQVRIGLSESDELKSDYRNLAADLKTVQVQIQELVRLETMQSVNDDYVELAREYQAMANVTAAVDNLVEDEKKKPVQETDVLAKVLNEITKKWREQNKQWNEINDTQIPLMQGRLVGASMRLAEINKEFNKEHKSVSWAFLSGLIATGFSALLAIGTAVKLYLDIQKLRLEQIGIVRNLRKG